MTRRLQRQACADAVPASAPLRVSAPNDRHEREADRKVVSLLGGQPSRRPAFAAAGPAHAPPIVHDVLRSPGAALDAAVGGEFSAAFGHDFSGVRVHTDGRSAASARAVNASAYTVGRDVVFGTGAYAPRTAAGRRLLAHELAHVAQQGPAGGVLQREPAPPAGGPASTPAAPAPAATPYVAHDATRYNFCFIMGSGGVFKIAEWFARAYFSEYEIVHAASFCGLLEHIDSRLQFRDADEKRQPKVGRVVIITHADKAGFFHFPLTTGGTEWVSPEEIVEFLTTGWLQNNGLLCRMASTRVGAKVDDQSRVDVKGCNFGRNQAALDALRGAFGGQATVTAPKLRVEMSLGSYGPKVPGRKTPAEVISWMVKNGYLPPSAEQWPAEMKAEFVASLFPAEGETKGIPADSLLDEKNKRKLAPSDPDYAANVATSKPTP